MRKKYSLLILLLSVVSSFTFAQISVTPGVSGNQLAQIMSGPGVIISNVNLISAALAVGSFTCNSCSLGMDSGIVLTNGLATNVIGPNNNGGASYAWSPNPNGDADLANSIGLPVTDLYDNCALEFDLTAQSDSVQFKYIFGSEEYPEFVCSSFNDAFAFFISGPGITGLQNIALIPGTSVPVAINSINPGSPGPPAYTGGATCNGVNQSLAYSQYYVNNGDGTQAPYNSNPYYIQYDGFTKTLTAAIGGLIPCQVYHLKLVIDDVGDPGYDSGVFIQANSLSSNAVTFDTTSTSVPGVDSAIRGCVDGIITFKFLKPVTSATTVNYTTGGTAVNGTDYSALSGSVQFPVGDSVEQVIIHPIGGATQTQSVTLYLTNSCSNIPYDSSTVYIAAPIVPVVTTTNVSCFGMSDGTATVTVTGGNPPYAPVWSNAATSNMITGLATGTYQVTVTDNAGCTASSSGNVSQPPVLTSTEIANNVLCFGGSSGSIIISPSGGTRPYSYMWNDGNTQQNRINIPVGTYTLIVTDAHLCTSYDTAVLTQPTALVLTDSIVNATCYGLSNGAVYLTVTGGTPPYAYDWGIGIFTQNATNIPADNYYPSVTDNQGCVADTEAIVTSPAEIIFNPYAVTPVTCFGQSNGIAQVNIGTNDGIPPFTYTWNGIAGNNPDSNLAANTYAVIATDANNCTAVDTVIVSQPPVLALSITGQDALCYDGADGTATDVATGGTPPYSYNWSDGQTAKAVGSLAPSSYQSTVTDNNGCTASNSVLIGQPGQIMYTIDSTPVKCIGSKDGTITVNITSGGVAPYTYAATTDLTNFIYTTDSVIEGLDTGYYTVLISDDNGCTLLDTTYVPNAIPDSFNITTDSTSCFGPQYTDGAIHITAIVGQNTPYQYKVDNSPYQLSGDFYNLGAGTHTIQASNYNSCITDTSALIGAPIQGITTVLPHDTTMQLGESIQLFSSFANYPASAIVSYNWVPSMGLSCVDCPDPVVSSYSHINNYKLTITYNNGCLASDSNSIIVTGSPQVFIPNSFTPNGDGNNDFFLIYGENIKTVNLKIFNRWGEMVFNSENQFLGWDGNYKGQPQQIGVYVYKAQITFLDNTQTLRTGSVTLLR